MLYIANIRLPTEKAHGIQIMKTCEALAHIGVEVELVVPKRHNFIKEDPFDFYGIQIQHGFSIKKLWSLDTVWWSVPMAVKKIAFWFQTMTFGIRTWLYLRHRSGHVLYTRDLFLALILPKKKLFYEVHWLPEEIRWYHRRAYRRAKGIVVISDALKKDLTALGLGEENICVARDAVDPVLFGSVLGPETMRKKLSLPEDGKMVVYTGHLFSVKGAQVLAEAAPFLRSGIHVYLVGGTKEDVERFRSRYRSKNLHIVGWRPQEEVVSWHRAADVLVLPNTSIPLKTARYTSPLKLFEYMMAGRPIVASRIPAICEVVDERMVELVRPDDPKALAAGIQAVIDNEALSKERSLKAYEYARAHTWAHRAAIVDAFVRRS